MNNTATNVGEMIILHTAFTNAQERLMGCFQSSDSKAQSEGLAIIGESGTGKTSLIMGFRADHKRNRTPDGMVVPILYAKAPSNPTVKSLAGALLSDLQAPLISRESEAQMTDRLLILLKNTETKMVMIDEFQHFYDRGKHKVMYHVADWLKLLMDRGRLTLVVAGLPSAKQVISSNEQLARRFFAPIELPRFDWRNLQHRGEFIAIAHQYYLTISETHHIPDLASENMAYRLLCATGGLISEASKLLRYAVLNSDSSRSISKADLDVAYERTMFDRPAGPSPFLSSLARSDDALPKGLDVSHTADALPVSKSSKTIRRGSRVPSAAAALVKR